MARRAVGLLLRALAGLNLLVRFACELAALAALALWGWSQAAPLPLRVALALSAPAAAALLWGAFVAPRARRRLRDPARAAVEALVFGSAALALAATGRPALALLLAGAAAVTGALVRVWPEPAGKP